MTVAQGSVPPTVHQKGPEAVVRRGTGVNQPRKAMFSVGCDATHTQAPPAACVPKCSGVKRAAPRAATGLSKGSTTRNLTESVLLQTASSSPAAIPVTTTPSVTTHQSSANSRRPGARERKAARESIALASVAPGETSRPIPGYTPFLGTRAEADGIVRDFVAGFSEQPAVPIESPTLRAWRLDVNNPDVIPLPLTQVGDFAVGTRNARNHGGHPHSEIANERRDAYAYAVQEALKDLKTGERLIDVGGSIGGLRRGRKFPIHNMSPTTCAADVSRNRDIRQLATATDDTFHLDAQVGCFHTMEECNCAPMMRDGNRVFLMCHSAYYLTEAAMARLRPGDRIYIIYHPFEGIAGTLPGFKWKVCDPESPYRIIEMSPTGPLGTTYRHFDITQVLQAGGFRAGNTVMCGSTGSLFKHTVVTRLDCVNTRFGTIPGWMSRFPVWPVQPSNWTPPPPSPLTKFRGLMKSALFRLAGFWTQQSPAARTLGSMEIGEFSTCTPINLVVPTTTHPNPAAASPQNVPAPDRSVVANQSANNPVPDSTPAFITPQQKSLGDVQPTLPSLPKGGCADDSIRIERLVTCMPTEGDRSTIVKAMLSVLNQGVRITELGVTGVTREMADAMGKVRSAQIGVASLAAADDLFLERYSHILNEKRGVPLRRLSNFLLYVGAASSLTALLLCGFFLVKNFKLTTRGSGRA